jgi:hypothetical protein
MWKVDGTDFSEEYKKLVDGYNNKEMRQTVAGYFAGLQPLRYDNDTPDPLKTQRSKSLQVMDFRRYFPFVSVEEDAHGKPTIVEAKHIGDFADLPPKQMLRNAKLLIKKMSGMEIDAARDLVTRLVKGDARDATITTLISNLIRKTHPRRGDSDPVPTISVGARVDAMDVDTPAPSSPAKESKILSAVQKPSDLQNAAVLRQFTANDRFLRHLAMVPDESVGDYLAFYKAALAQLEQTAADQYQAALAGLDHFLGQIEQHKDKDVVRIVVKKALEHVTSTAADKKSLAQHSDTFLVTQRDAKSASKLSGTSTIASTIATAFAAPARVDTYDQASFGVPATTALNSVAAERLSFNKNIASMKKITMANSAEQYAYDLLLRAPNRLDVHQQFILHCGIQFFRLNFWRPFQRYRMLAVTAMKGGPNTLLTAFGHQIVTPTMRGIEGFVAIVAQFRSAVIPRAPEKISLLPYSFCDRVISEINTRMCQSAKELQMDHTRKPSVVVEVVPLDETNYDFPMHFFKDDIHDMSPLSKHSGVDLLLERFNPEWVQDQAAAVSGTHLYQSDIKMSFVGHRSWKLDWDQARNDYTAVVGTGPRRHSCMNSTDAADVWNGQSLRFAPKDLAQYSYAIEV